MLYPQIAQIGRVTENQQTYHPEEPQAVMSRANNAEFKPFDEIGEICVICGSKR